MREPGISSEDEDMSMSTVFIGHHDRSDEVDQQTHLPAITAVWHKALTGIRPGQKNQSPTDPSFRRFGPTSTVSLLPSCSEIRMCCDYATARRLSSM